jgi:tight adherence protein B
MTPPSHKRKSPLLRRLGLALGLILLCCLATSGVVDAAPGDLTLSISSLDLSAYPQASFVLQLGGGSASSLDDLGKDSVALQIDGKSTPLDSLQAAGAGIAAPVQTVLLIDESGSMNGEAIKAASDAAAAFVDAMRPGDSAAVEAFNEQFRTLQTFTSDKNVLKASLAGLSPQKETALYDALGKALASFGPASSGRARYVILLSDGGDTASAATLDQATAAVRSAGVPVYAIGLKSTEFDAQPMASLAEASGSRYLETPTPGALTSLYQTLAKEIHNQYQVKFTLPPSSSAAGDLTVQVATGGLEAQAEQGFFYPTTTTVTTGSASMTTGTTTLVASSATPGAAAVVAETGVVGRFLRWEASDYIVGLVVFFIVLGMLVVLSGVLFPRRDVLAEYDSAMNRTAALGPQALDEPAAARPGALSRATSRALALRGYQDPLQQMIDDAALKFRASEFVLLQFVAIVVVVVLAKLLGAPLILIVVLALVFVVAPLLWLSSKGSARRRAFDDQVPNTLTMLAGSLKAGQGFEQALGVVARESPEPTASEFQRVLAQIRLGVPPEDALQSTAERMGSQAFAWATMSTMIQRQVGGNLAEIYESTAFVLRERAKLRRTIKTLTAEGRLSAIILIVLPFVIGGLVGIVNRDYLKPLIETRLGNLMLALAAVLMIAGIFWMRAIIRVDK